MVWSKHLELETQELIHISRLMALLNASMNKLSMSKRKMGAYYLSYYMLMLLSSSVILQNWSKNSSKQWRRNSKWLTRDMSYFFGLVMNQLENEIFFFKSTMQKKWLKWLPKVRLIRTYVRPLRVAYLHTFGLVLPVCFGRSPHCAVLF